MARFIEDLRPVSVWTPWKKKSLFDQLVEAYFYRNPTAFTIDIMPWEQAHADAPPKPNAVSVYIGHRLSGHAIEVVVTNSGDGYYEIHKLIFDPLDVTPSARLSSIVRKIKGEPPFYSEDKELLRWVEEMDLMTSHERSRIRIIQLTIPKKGNN